MKPVYFSIVPTRLHPNSEPIRIVANVKNSHTKKIEYFDQFLVPTEWISDRVYNYHGYSNEDLEQMAYDGNAVEQFAGLKYFTEFLDSYSSIFEEDICLVSIFIAIKTNIKVKVESQMKSRCKGRILCHSYLINYVLS